MTIPEFDFEVDACGLMCPLPLLRLKKALQGVENGQVVRVLATDPAAVLDFGVFIEQARHDLLCSYEQDRILYFFIRKGG